MEDRITVVYSFIKFLKTPRPYKSCFIKQMRKCVLKNTDFSPVLMLPKYNHSF